MAYYEGMNKANIQDLKKDLAKFVRRIESGETLILCKRNLPIAEIKPFNKKIVGRRAFGKYKGSVKGDISKLLNSDPQITTDFESSSLEK